MFLRRPRSPLFFKQRVVRRIGTLKQPIEFREADMGIDTKRFLHRIQIGVLGNSEYHGARQTIAPSKMIRLAHSAKDQTDGLHSKLAG